MVTWGLCAYLQAFYPRCAYGTRACLQKTALKNPLRTPQTSFQPALKMCYKGVYWDPSA